MAPFKSTQSFSVGTFLRTFRNRDAVGPAALNSPVRTDQARPVLEEYVYTGLTETTLFVTSNTKYITFAGIAEGGNGGGGGGNGGRGGGGGAANLAGYTIGPTGIYDGTTLYIGIGDGAPTYVRTESHTGPIIFELNRGTDGGGGGAANPTYSSVAGGDGGPGGSRFNNGTAGGSVTNSGAGGGGGGGYGDASPVVPGGAGQPGGTVTMTSPFLAPNGGGPASAWTFGPAGGGSAGGGNSGGSPGSGSGGGGAQGVIFNSVAYGGGGGGGGGAPSASGAGGAGGSGMSGFLIVQLHTAE